MVEKVSQEHLSNGLINFVDAPHLTAIGQVVVQWSSLEVIIESYCWQAAGVRNDIGRVITSQLGIQHKMDLLCALLGQTDQALAERVTDVCDFIRNCLVGRRNMVVHGSWFQLPSLPIARVSKFSSKGKLINQGTFIEVEELQALAKDIADVTAWFLDTRDALPPLKQRPGGLGCKTPNTQNHQEISNRKQRVLQPLTSPHTPVPTMEEMRAAKKQRLRKR